MIFIVSSTGIFIYKTHCTCTGDEQVGIYVKPETCDENFHVHHTHDTFGIEKSTSESLCHECSHQIHDCGCASPEVRFFKLSNDFTQDEVSFERAPGVKITDIFSTVIIYCVEPILKAETHNIRFELPPNIKSSKFLLISFNQLKIPLSA
ncbi:MAG: hypothetical protein IPF54_15095 [Draconibacterium sp.]|nr:hypothetical protein [Draconibacterium sp.]